MVGTHPPFSSMGHIRAYSAKGGGLVQLSRRYPKSGSASSTVTGEEESHSCRSLNWNGLCGKQSIGRELSRNQGDPVGLNRDRKEACAAVRTLAAGIEAGPLPDGVEALGEMLVELRQASNAIGQA